MKPDFHHLAAMVRQKREQVMADSSYQSHMSTRLTGYFRDAFAKILGSVKIHGWWELNTPEEVREIVMEELYELRDAWDRHDYHSPHGVLAELDDCQVVIAKAKLRLLDMAEQGEV